MSGWFARFRARNVGKTIAAFYKEIFDTVLKDKANIEMKVEGVGQLVQAIYPLVSEDSKFSVKKMLKNLNQKNGRIIGLFFKEILDPWIRYIPESKKDKKTGLEVVSEFL